MMNRRELVQAALKRRAVERLPILTWCHFGPDASAGEPWVKAHLDWLEDSRTDILKAMNDAGYPLTPTNHVSEASDWRHLRATPLSHPRLHTYLEDLERLLDRVGESTPVIVTVFDPFYTAADSRGGTQAWVGDYARLRAELRADAAAVSAGLAAIAEGLGAFAAACIERGAAGIFLATLATDPALIEPAVYDEFVLPHVAAVMASSHTAGSWCDIVHVCGNSARLEIVESLPSSAVSWAAGGGNCSLSAGQRQLRRCVVGGFSTTALSADGTLDQAMAEATTAVAETSGLGLLLAPGCAIPEHPGANASSRAFDVAARLSRSTF